MANWAGEIPNGTVWTNSEVQRITGNVTIPAGSTLTIQSGTVVKFNAFQGLSIKVDGTLAAQGTAGQPIVFTTVTDDTVGGDTNGDGNGSTAYGGQWDTIQFTSNSAGSTLDRVEVRYGGSTSAGQVFVNGGPLTLTNSTLRNSATAGVRIVGSNPTLTNVVYKDNVIAASMDLASNPAISGVTMTTNTVNALRVDGGALSADGNWNDPEITYVVHDAVTVPEGRTLNIAAGQIIKFREFASFGLTVNGTLKANGTAIAPVVFTTTRDDAVGGDAYNDGSGNTPYAGQWDAITFNATSTGNVLDRVEVRYGGSASAGQVVVNGAPLTLTNSRLFDSNTAGIRIVGASPTLTNIVYHENTIAASMDLGSSPAISGVSMTSNTVNALRVDGGSLPADATWNDPDITYVIHDAVTVPAGRTLNIAAGQIIKFREFANFGMTINGTLKANGTAVAPVIFTTTRDDAAGGDAYNDGTGNTAYTGQWDAIIFNATSTGNVLDRVEVRYGGQSSAGQVVANGAPLTLTNSRLFDSATAGIRMAGASPTLTNVVYHENTIAASMDLASSPTISGVTMTSNGVNALRVDGGSLPADATWNDPEITYVVHDAVTVPAGKTLNVAAGQVIKFREFANFGMTVNGTLKANGTAVSPVIFTTTRDDAAGGDAYNDGPGNTAYTGQWDALVFNATSTANVLDRVEVRYGGQSSAGQVLVNGGPLMLTNSTLFDSATAGVRVQGASPTLANVTYKDNAIAASMDLAASPAISGVTMVNNDVNALRVDGGTLAADATWNNPAITYVVNDSVTVPVGKTLTITAGLVVKFREFANLRITVDGTLKAQGAAGLPVIFTTTTDDAAGGDAYNNGTFNTAYAGQWSALVFNSTSAGNLLENTELRYGGQGGKGVVRVVGGPLTLSKSKVFASGTEGLRVEGAAPTASSVAFENNLGAAISVDHAGDVKLSEVSASGNGANAIVIDGGSLLVDTSWTAQGLPFQLGAHLTIPAGFSATIGPDAVFDVRETVNLLGAGTVNNTGLIRKSTNASAATVVPTIINTGAIKVLGSSLNVQGGVTNNANGVVTGPAGPTLAIGKDFVGTTTNATFEPLPRIFFNGSGTAAAPQLLEALSRDEGHTSSGFDDNFAFYSLALSGSTVVRLVDNADNATGSGAEAVYVENLSVPSGTTLDLNNLKLYARTTQFGGTVQNGTITMVPDGGPLGRDNVTPGRISVSGQIDDWTIFGRAGDSLTITVSTGSGGATPPLATTINFAEVTLLDPSGAVVTSASNTTSGADLTLNAVTLPADGVYKIRVQAPAAQSTRTGNYVLTAWNASVTTQPLELGRGVVGNIDTPFRADRWTFSASAGQAVRFTLVNAESPAIQFDLTGPNGFTAFTNVSASSGEIILPATGQYALTAHSSNRQTGAYAFRVDQTTIAPLVLNAPTVVNLAGGAHSQLFQFTVPQSQQILISLADAAAANRNEVFVKQGAVPSRGDYQHRSTLAASANQQVSIPTAGPGVWYVLVYTESAPVEGSYTLEVSGASVFLTKVTPDHAGNSAEMTLTLAGLGFDSTSTVSLVSASNEIIAATSTRLDLPAQLTTTFAAGAPAGVYSVRVVKAGGGTATLASAFEVKPGGQSNLVTNLLIPSVLGYHIASTLYLQYSNTGDVAMPAPLLILTPTQTHADQSVTTGAFLTLDKSRVTEGFWTSAIPTGFSHTVEVLASGATPGVLQPGESVEVPVYYAGWQQPWDFSYPQFDFNLGVVTTADSTPLDWAAQQVDLRPADIDPDVWNVVYGQLTTDYGSTMGQFAARLGQDAAYLGQLGLNVRDVSDLWSLAMNRAVGISPLSSLASGRDALSAAPGIPLVFDRFFSANLLGRNELGRLGRGWTDSWDRSLTTEADGTVTITGVNGSVRTFQPDSRRSGVYFAQPGDYGTLTRAGNGTFLVREKDGASIGFRADGMIDFFQDLNGNRVTAGYTGSLLTSLNHSAGSTIQITYNAAGRIGTIVDAVGRQTQFTYDASNEHLVTVTDFAGRVTQYTYDTGSNPSTRHALLRIDSPGGGQQHLAYDTRGRVTDLYLSGNAERTTFTYDASSVTLGNAAGGTVKSYFDHRGLIAKVEDALRNITLFAFDGNYNVTKVTDPAGQVSTSTFDARGNLTSFTDPLGNISRFEFAGPANRLTKFTDPKGNSTRYAYDARANLLATALADGSVEKQSSDATGNRLTWTNRRNQTMSFTYDSAGRVVSKTRSTGARTDFGYDDHGKLTTVTDASGTITFAYDAADRPTKITYPGGKFVQFAYDPAGRRTQLLDQDGFTVNYLYDQAGRLEKLTNGQGGTIVTYAYDAAGRLVSKTTAGGGQTTWQYNPAGQLLALRNLGPGATLHSQFDYTYDNLGRVASTTMGSGQWTYAYDATSQLTRATFTSNNPAVIPHRDEQYVYDASGNRVRTVINGVQTEYTTNAVNQYTRIGAATYTYDLDGNLVEQRDGSAISSFVYDDENQLVSSTTPNGTSIFEYNALSNRVASIQDGLRTDYLIDPLGIGMVIAEYRAGAAQAHYVHGLGLTSRVDAAGTASFYEFDARGNTTGLATTAGALANEYMYSPFGQVLTSSTRVANPFTFSGKFAVIDDSSGRYFMRAREYDSSTGQFHSDDPVGLGGGDINIRRYVVNNPLSSVDPSGLGRFGKEGLKWFIPNYIPIVYDVLSLNYMEPVHEEFFFDHAVKVDGQRASINAGFGGQRFQDHSAYTMDDQYFDDRIMAQAIMEVEQDAIYGRGPSYTFLTFFGIWGGNCQSLAQRARNRYWEIIARGAAGRKDPLAPKVTTHILGNSKNAAARDPNEKIGPSGYGAQLYVDPNRAFPYEVHFENDNDATAPAQRVTITDKLSANLDWDTLELTEIAWGDITVDVPAGLQHYETTVEMTYNGTTFVVGVEVGLRAATGELFATFQSLDPETELPPAVLTGFLPPEDGTGRGQGHISYTIRSKPSLASGTSIRNVALITFDVNPSIATDQVDPHDPSKGIDLAKQALVTVDAGVPTSNVTALPALENARFNVKWTGSDETGGSGIASYDVFVSDNSGPFTLWQDDVLTTKAVFTGEIGHTYRFYAIATDNVGHVAVVPLAADAQTVVSAEDPWQNRPHRLDVNDDGIISSGDALAIINQINAGRPRNLTGQPGLGDEYIDTTGDEILASGDVLDVVNHINAYGAGPVEAEGEAALLAADGEAAAITIAPHDRASAVDSLFALWADDWTNALVWSGRRVRG